MSHIIAIDQEERSSSHQSPKPGCSSEGQAPSKPPRGTRSSPGSNREGGKTLGPKLNHPPRNGNINVQNGYEALSDMKEDYHGVDQAVT